MLESPKVTVIILSFQNFSKLFSAVDSVIMQDYSNIELIISDDGSDYFEGEILKRHIEKKLNEKEIEGDEKNITSLVINKNPENLGTVKNLNVALSHMTGDYYMLLGADDLYYKSDVISTFVEVYKTCSPDTLLLAGQVAMYTQGFQKYLYLYLNKLQKEAIYRKNPKELFSIMTNFCIIPEIACCHRKEFIKAVGGYDEDYFILEDRPTLLRMARLGIAPKYIDMIVTKHAAGGIANGNADYGIDILKRYLDDEMILYEKEIKPYLNLITPQDKVKLDARLKNNRKRYVMECELFSLSKPEKIRQALKKPTIFLWMFERKLHKAKSFFNYKTSNTVELIKSGLIMLACAAIIYDYSGPIELIKILSFLVGLIFGILFLCGGVLRLLFNLKKYLLHNTVI